MSGHNQEAERAAPGITDPEIAGIMGWRGPGAYTEATLRNIRRVLEEDRARRAPAVGEDGLPPLPKAALESWHIPGQSGHYYTAEQYRQGQREAVAVHERVHNMMVEQCRELAYQVADLRAQLARKSQEGTCG